MGINMFYALMYTCIFPCFFPGAFSTINLTATANTQTFVSHDGFDETTPYPNNYTREWLVTAASENYTITLEFTHCELETGNGKGVCIQDIIYFYDGPDSNSSLLQGTCCGLQHDNVIQGTGSQVYIRFSTDQTLSYTGFSINYMLNGVPTSTIPGTYITPAAQVQPSTDEGGEQHKLFFILALVISIVVVLIVTTIFTIIYLKKTNQRKSALQPDNLTTQSKFHVKHRQPHPDLLIYSKPDNFPVACRETEENDDDVFVNKCVIMSAKHPSPSKTLNTHTQPTPTKEVSTIFTVDDEKHNSIHNTMNDTNILNTPLIRPHTSTRLEEIKHPRNHRQHEIISTMAVSDGGVSTVEYANSVNVMCLNMSELNTTSTEQKVPITKAASKYCMEDVNKGQVEHQSDISEMQHQKTTPEVTVNEENIQTQNEHSSSTDKFYPVSKDLSILSGPWKSLDVSFKENEDTIQAQNGHSSITDKVYPVSNAFSISSDRRKFSDVSLKSPINTDSLLRRFILPPVEAIQKSSEDDNVSVTTDYRSRDDYTPGTRRLKPKQFPILVNTKSPKSSKSSRKIWR